MIEQSLFLGANSEVNEFNSVLEIIVNPFE